MVGGISTAAKSIDVFVHHALDSSFDFTRGGVQVPLKIATLSDYVERGSEPSEIGLEAFSTVDTVTFPNAMQSDDNDY